MYSHTRVLFVLLICAFCSTDASGEIDVEEFARWLGADEDEIAALQASPHHASPRRGSRSQASPLHRRASVSSTFSVATTASAVSSGSTLARNSSSAAVVVSLRSMESLKRRLRASAYSVGGIDYKRLFRKYDTDGSGAIELPEFIAALRTDGHVSEQQLSDANLEAIFDAVDTDGR